MKLKSLLSGLIGVALLASCSTTNEVVSGRGGIQKRKYNDGYYISWGNKFNDKNKSENTTEDASIHQEIAEVTEATKPEITTVSDVPFEATNAIDAPFGNGNNTQVIVPAGTENFPQTIITSEIDTDNSIARPLSVSKNDKKIVFKPGRLMTDKIKLVDHLVSESSGAASADVMLILLIILCFILPPLAVFIFEGGTTRFVIDLILWLIGWGLGWYFFRGGLAGLCSLVAVIYALLIILSII